MLQPAVLGHVINIRNLVSYVQEWIWVTSRHWIGLGWKYHVPSSHFCGMFEFHDHLSSRFLSAACLRRPAWSCAGMHVNSPHGRRVPGQRRRRTSRSEPMAILKVGKNPSNCARALALSPRLMTKRLWSKHSSATGTPWGPTTRSTRNTNFQIHFDGQEFVAVYSTVLNQRCTIPIQKNAAWTSGVIKTVCHGFHGRFRFEISKCNSYSP